MEDKDLDKIFREAFIGAEEIPNPNNWDKIEANLGKTAQVKSIPSIKKIGMIAASFTLICLGGYYASKTVNSNDTNLLIHNEPTNSIVKNHKVNITPVKDNKVLIENKKHIADQSSSSNIYRISSSDNRHLAVENEVKSQLQQPELELMDKINLTLTSIEPSIPKKEELVIIQVTDIDDIKPLIENEEEEETMLASISTERKENKNIVTTVLNKLSENLDPNKEQTVRFVADEEGSFAINIINTFAKNRNKKRK